MNRIEKIKVAAIGQEMPYGFRYRLKDDALRASMKQFGILTPIVVADAKRPVVIAGHKRLHAARTLKMKEVPALVTEKLKAQDAFLLNLISNWQQVFPDTDRAGALGKASREFRLKESDILSVVMPLLGLPADKSVLELYLKADQFSPPVKDLIEEEHWPLRAVTFLFKFSKKDQEYFAQKIGTPTRLTHSQLLQAGEWLVDILKRTGKTLPELCREHKVLEELELSGRDPRVKADRFFARIKRLRFPGYSLYLEEFDKRRADVLRDIPGLRLEPVQGFETPGFELHSRIKTPEDLERFLQKLSERRFALNSLFEIVS